MVLLAARWQRSRFIIGGEAIALTGCRLLELPLWKAAALGLIQGATEFLPVSSSGHLALAERLLGLDLPGLSFEIAVHAGTLLAVLVVYRHDLAGLLQAALRVLSLGAGRRSATDREDIRLLGLLLVGSVPAAVVGLAARPVVEAAFGAMRSVGVGWLFTAVALFAAHRLLNNSYRAAAEDQLQRLTVAQALWIGCFQAIAIFPGVSRSGSTIAAAVMTGLGPTAAARFSFLLSVIAIGGAALLDLPDVLRGGFTFDPGAVIVGLVTAAASGLVAIRYLLQLLRKGSLLGFALYCLLLGITVLSAF